MDDFSLYLSISMTLVCIYCVINSLEIIYNLVRHGEIAPSNYYECGYPSSLSPVLSSKRPGSHFNGAAWILIFACSARLLLAAIAIIISPTTPYAATGLAATTLLINYMRPVGGDGAMQMAAVVLIPFAFLDLPIASEKLEYVVALFISAQITLAYFSAGLSKARSATWRKGLVIKDVLATESYGFGPLARILEEHQFLSRAICALVIAIQLFFPLWIILPGDAVAVYLGILAAFHIGLAITMGLNDFPWAFTATYPMVYFIATSGFSAFPLTLA